MLRDFKFLRRNSAKNEEAENVPVNPKDFAAFRIPEDSSRPPLNTIQEPATQNPKEQEVSARGKVDKTPSKAKGKASDHPALPIRTPDKHGAKNRFGWAQKNESGATTSDDLGNFSAQVSNRGGGVGNGGFGTMTPRVTRTVARAPVPSFSECNSTQSTPSKSVSKPPSSSLRSKVDGGNGARPGNFAALYKGLPMGSGSSAVVNSVEVPHFDLKEDPSFWMEHNVQVVIRVRPLNAMERSSNGYNRCLKQESAQTITWIGHPDTRFTFDHVACETVDQEMLFRMACLPMVENCLSGYNSCMFAYGQTGSGKTYTMLGEIDNLELKPSPHRGMTPRIFEFLFARIQAEEESRRDEQ